jgi:hypothetical protein
MDKLILHIIKLEKIVDLSEGIKIVKYMGYDDTLVDSIAESQVFDKNVEDELPILILKYSKWDIINVYKYILSDDFTVFKAHYPYSVRAELKRLNLLNPTETKLITKDKE